MNAIITRNLSRRFGKTQAVCRLNLKIPAGSLYGLIGPNGAGKTTALRMLAGLLEPDSGEIRICDLPLEHYRKDIQRLIGFMPDFFGVYENLLVWEYLDFYARCYKLSPAHRRRVISELLELVDLTEKRDAYIQTLSRGMCQRLCLAHALIHDPQILLLDEPASGLDPRARVEMRELLRELRRMGKTILLSSHILTELAELCDRIAIMERGGLVISGTLDEILQRAAGSRTIEIQVLGASNNIENLLQNTPGIQNIYPMRINDGSIHYRFEFSGNDEAVADLLEQLIAVKIRLAAFAESPLNLEEAFLNLTEGEVSNELH